MWIARNDIAPPPVILFGDTTDRVAGKAPDRADPSKARRVLTLTGTWAISGDAFTLEAVLEVAGIHASGPIHWQRTRGSLSGVEIVHGSLTGVALEVAGVSTTRGLACDRYRISLDGNELAGAFSGASRAFGAWDGHLQGRYRFEHDPQSGQ